MSIVTRILPATLIAAAIAGCSVPANDRMTLNDSVRLEAFTPQPAATPATPAEQVIAPSLTGISRANWQPTEVPVPVVGPPPPPILPTPTPLGQ